MLLCYINNSRVIRKSAFIQLFTPVVPSDTVSFTLASPSRKHVNQDRQRHKCNKHDKKNNLDNIFKYLEEPTSGERKYTVPDHHPVKSVSQMALKTVSVRQ